MEEVGGFRSARGLHYRGTAQTTSPKPTRFLTSSLDF